MEGICWVLGENKNVKYKPKSPGSFVKILDYWEYSKKSLLNDKLIGRI